MEQRTEWDAAQVEDPELGDEVEQEPFFELLANLGVQQRPARVLAFLAVEGNGRSVDIEEACGMRQPEVSQATIELRDKGWVEAKPEKTEGKGRPVNNYHLKISLKDIYNEIEGRKREEINLELARLERLKQLITRLER